MMTSSRNLRAARPVFMGLLRSVSRIPSKWMDAAEVAEEGPVRGRGRGGGREGGRAYHGPDISFMRDRSERAAAAVAALAPI